MKSEYQWLWRLAVQSQFQHPKSDNIWKVNLISNCQLHICLGVITIAYLSWNHYNCISVSGALQLHISVLEALQLHISVLESLQLKRTSLQPPWNSEQSMCWKTVPEHLRRRIQEREEIKVQRNQFLWKWNLGHTNHKLRIFLREFIIYVTAY